MRACIDTQAFPLPWIVAHRGYRKKYPENTLAAFQAAMDAGAPMMELDVTLSRDRKPVIIHDDTLERTTNGPGRASDHTMADLQQLDAGSWFHPDFADQTLPGLAELFDLVNGRALINVEIKSNAYEPRHPPDAIERQVVDLINEKKIGNLTLISSFSVDILEQLSFMEDAPSIALISEGPATMDTVTLCQRLKVFSWHPYFKILTREQVEMMHAAGIKVFPYTVNTPEDHEWMRSINVDGVITDDPELFITESTSEAGE